MMQVLPALPWLIKKDKFLKLYRSFVDNKNRVILIERLNHVPMIIRFMKKFNFSDLSIDPWDDSVIFFKNEEIWHIHEYEVYSDMRCHWRHIQKFVAKRIKRCITVD